MGCNWLYVMELTAFIPSCMYVSPAGFTSRKRFRPSSISYLETHTRWRSGVNSRLTACSWFSCKSRSPLSNVSQYQWEDFEANNLKPSVVMKSFYEEEPTTTVQVQEREIDQIKLVNSWTHVYNLYHNNIITVVVLLLFSVDIIILFLSLFLGVNE